MAGSNFDAYPSLAWNGSDVFIGSSSSISLGGSYNQPTFYNGTYTAGSGAVTWANLLAIAAAETAQGVNMAAESTSDNAFAVWASTAPNFINSKYFETGSWGADSATAKIVMCRLQWLLITD